MGVLEKAHVKLNFQFMLPEVIYSGYKMMPRGYTPQRKNYKQSKKPLAIGLLM